MFRDRLTSIKAIGRHHRRTAIEALMHRLPPTTADDVAAAFYVENLVPTVDLLAFSSPAPVPAFEKRVLYGPSTDVIPATPTLPEAGRWSPPINAYRLTDVALDVDSGLVFTRDGVVEQSRSPRMRSAADLSALTGATRRMKLGAHERVAGVVAPLGEASLTYYHILIEVTARALQLAAVDPQIVLLTSDELAPITTTLLARAGLRYRVLPRGTVVRADETWFCDRPSDRNWPRHGDLEVLRRAFLPSRSDERPAPTAKVYVSRSNAARGLTDERILEDYLTKRDFVIAHFEDMTIDEQVALMASARLVVGPHGAGLTNIIFMRPGGRVVELASPALATWAFRHLSAMSGLDYDFLALPHLGDYALATDAVAALEGSGLLAD